MRRSASWGRSFLMAGNIGRVRERTQRGKRSFYLDFRPHGRVYGIPDPGGAGTIPIRDRSTADRILENVRQAFIDGKTVEQALAPWLSRVAPEMRVGARYTLFCKRLADQVAAGEKSQSYLDEIARYGKVGGYLDTIRELPVFTLNFGHLEDLDAELIRRGLAPKTRSHVIGALRTFCRWLKRRGDIDQVPDFPTITVPEYLPRIIEPEAQRQILDAVPDRLRGPFLAAAFHGLRPTEIVRLNVADYDWKAGVIRARRTKSKRSRVIPASGELRTWIERYVDPAGRLTGAPLFTNPRGRARDRRWTWDALADTWTRAARQVGVEARLYEGTKHSSATAARRRGVALEVIQHALGHADVRSTERYARAAELAPVEVLESFVSRVSLAENSREKDSQKQ